MSKKLYSHAPRTVNCGLEELLQSMTVEQCCKAFKDVIKRLEVCHIPVKKFSKKENAKTIWMTYKATKLVMREHNVYNRYKSVHHPTNIIQCNRSLPR